MAEGPATAESGLAGPDHEQEYYDTARDPLELDNIAGGGVPAGN